MELQSPQPEQSVSLDNCLKLLKGGRDEERIAGLLLVTKLCKSDDLTSLRAVYDAVGPSFLERLLKTGLSKGVVSSGGEDSRDAFLLLSVTVLAAFCRVPEIASSEDMVSYIPMILEVMLKESISPVNEECYEFLYLVSAASVSGIATFYKSGGMKVLASNMSSLPDGSHSMELAMNLVQLMLSKQSLGVIEGDYRSELAIIVAVIARQFAVLHNAMKFEALHILSGIFSSGYLAHLRDALRSIPNEEWSNHMRVGVVAMLQNRIAPAEKFEALILAESMISIMGERWLIGQISLPNVKEPIPANRCLMLILESSRVEVAVLLNELAYSKFEASKSSSLTAAETVMSKQRNLTVVFALVESTIKLISIIGETEGDPIDESTFTQVIKGLNETISLVLEYLQDAKDHGQKKGNDLLASVRIVGSYLAEAPIACKEKVRELLGYMLSVEGEEESSPFYSTCFLIPLLCQMTETVEGCSVLASSGGYKAVVDCLIKMIGQDKHVEDDGRIFLACDTIMNFLLKRNQFQFPKDESSFYSLLKALILWTENTNDPTIVMMAASLCTLILDLTSEDALLNHPNFDNTCFPGLARLIGRSLASRGQGITDDAKSDMDLLEIITAGYSRWADRFPHIRDAVERR